MFMSHMKPAPNGPPENGKPNNDDDDNVHVRPSSVPSNTSKLVGSTSGARTELRPKQPQHVLLVEWEKNIIRPLAQFMLKAASH